MTRLQIDYIDLYQLHGFDPATPIEDTLCALNDLVRQGLIRYIGISNWAAWQIAKALGIPVLHAFTKFASVQSYYTIVARDVEREIIPLALDAGLGVLAWSPLAGGLLSGKVGRENVSAEGTRRGAMAFPPVDMDRAYKVIDLLRSIAKDNSASVAQVAIAWLLHQRGLTSVLIGTKKAEQLTDNLGAVDVTLSAIQLATLDEASRLPAEYPGWMINFWSQSRADQLQAARG